MIWYPAYKWAEEVIEECAAFPYGRNDDYVDSMTQALMRYRQFGALQHDYDEEIENVRDVGLLFMDLKV
jgi:hypothetical protein